MCRGQEQALHSWRLALLSMSETISDASNVFKFRNGHGRASGLGQVSPSFLRLTNALF